MLYQNQIAEPVTCVPGAESEMSSSGKPDLPVLPTDLKIQYTKVSKTSIFCFNLGVQKLHLCKTLKVNLSKLM